MSSYVQIFLGPPQLSERQVVADVEAATGLSLELTDVSKRQYRGNDGTRGLMLILKPNDYDDEPHLPSFSEHPVELEFYPAEKSSEPGRPFLEETFRRLRATGRYTLFATKDLHVRIDPD